MLGQILVGPAIQVAAFPWVPEWLHMTMNPEEMASLDRNILIAMWAMSVAVFAGVGGVTQELFARGFLLPRMAHLGWAAPVLNALFFAMLHVAAPWGWPIFFAASLIWSVAAYWTRSVKIALWGHVGMLLVQSTMMGVLIASA